MIDDEFYGVLDDNLERAPTAEDLFELISAEDDTNFYSCLEHVKNPEELNVIHQVYTPLGLSCAFDRWEFVHALLRKGADVNIRTGALQQCPIHFAAMNDQKGVKCTQLLYEYGADLNTQDGEGNSPLYHACAVENVLLFKFLMEKGANANLINSDGKTPLMRAILSQNEYMIKHLVDAGCEVNYPSGEPFEYLMRYPGLNDCVDLFLKKGVDVNKRAYFLTAAAHGHIEGMKLLKDLGVDINAISGILEFTALHHACNSGRASHKIVKLLLDWGLEVNSWSITFDTPLHIACRQCNLKKVLVLLDYKADVNARNASLATPLTALLMTEAQELGILIGDFFKIFKILIAAGTKITNCDLEIFRRAVPGTLHELLTQQQIFEFLESVRDKAREPMKLRDLCRSNIYNFLRARVENRVQELPLPVVLKDFLMFKDILAW